VNRILSLALALLLIAGCGQSQDTTEARSEPATTAAATAQPEPAAAATTATAQPAQPAPAAPAAAASAQQKIQLAQVDLNAVEAAGFIEGRHYERISPAQPTSSSPGQIEVAEFFMYSCVHCYNLEPFVTAWLENKPAHIDFVHVPTTWDALRILHAQAFYAAEALGVADEIHLPFFQEIHVSGNYLDSPEKLASFFGRFGVSSDDFQSVVSSFSVMTQTNRANELGTRYRIQATPTIVINGKYRTGVDQAGGYDQLFELIELLAAAELGR
jgi:thiol:disulfide interchange protein DsbA